MNKMREQFEKWFSGNLEKNHTSDYKDSDGESFYLHLATRTAWGAWKASRENLVIQLPPAHEGLFQDCLAFDETDVKLALEDQGVKYK